MRPMRYGMFTGLSVGDFKAVMAGSHRECDIVTIASAKTKGLSDDDIEQGLADVLFASGSLLPVPHLLETVCVCSSLFGLSHTN